MAPEISAARKEHINQLIEAAMKRRNEIENQIKEGKDTKDGKKVEGFDYTFNIFGGETLTQEEKEYAYEKYAGSYLDSFDTTKDEQCTVDDFIKKELEDIEKMDEGPDKDKAVRKLKLMAQNMDINGDDKISKQEFAFILKEADKMDKNLDGSISVKSEEEMLNSLCGLNADDKTVNAIATKYLNGENLSATEKEILNLSSTKIRTNMANIAKDSYGTTFDAPKDKDVYAGDIKSSSAPGADAGQTTDTSWVMNFLNNYMQNFSGGLGNMPGLGAMTGMDTVSFSDSTAGSNILFKDTTSSNISFRDNTNYINGIDTTAQGTKGKSNNLFGSLFNLGGLLGMGMNLGYMIKGLFGGGGFGGGFGWWFR